MARNTIKCNLTNSERITNNSYLKKRLDSLGVDEEYFRAHYATKKAVTELRASIETGGLVGWAHKLGKSEDWLLRCALMNGKNKLFSEFVYSTRTHSTTDTVKDVPGELEGAPFSSGNFSGQGQVMVDYFKSKVK
tara:strand:- start:164 stop:568 length:405 start_codon:yes stop_codon:yes gene_type:complete